MFSRRKEETQKKPRRSGGSGNTGLSQYGLIDIPNFDNFDKMDEGDDNDDDDALEAELLALTTGAGVPKKQRKVVAPLASANLDKMVADSLRDIPSDESLSGDDNDDDPALLAELTGLISDEEVEESNSQPAARQEPVASGGIEALLSERIAMYRQAEANAKAAAETSRARRFGRGIKTLEGLIKLVSSGRSIDENEIPPPVAVQITKKPSDTAAQPDAECEDSSPPSMPAPAPPVPPRSIPPSAPQRPAPSPPVRSPGAIPVIGLSSNPEVSLYSQLRPEQIREGVTVSAPEIQMVGQDQNERIDESEKEETVKLLTSRRDEYKSFAVKAKREGEIELALRLVKVAKQFDTVLSALNEGKPIDLSAMPPPPALFVNQLSKKEDNLAVQVTTDKRKEEQEKQRSCEEPSASEAVSEPQPDPAEAAPEEEVYQVTASTVSEALEQRLKLYQVQEEAAREAGNSSKARRMGRIVKQYQDAIKLHKAGKPIPVDELPTPPGYAPIPVPGSTSSNSGSSSVVPESKTSTPLPVVPAATSASSDPSPDIPSVSPSKPTPVSKPAAADPQPVTDKETQRINARRGAVERQMSFLTSRQKEFKLAALEAKKKGEMNQAKEYLRLAKGFEPLLDAASSGLPVDMNSVPIPPASKAVLESDFDIVSNDDCTPNSDSDIFDKLESDLSSQLKMCMQTRNHFKAIGDVASANRFEQLALHSKKDLDVVRAAHKRNEFVPRFHYETRSFSIVQCNTDLTDNDLELTFVQGINYNVPNPKEVDTYIKFEFPYPSDEPVKDKTAVVYNTNNPEYNVTFPLTIHRSVRACQRVFKRHSIKCEIWSKGGFFRGDTLIGSAAVKLQPLETKCTLHDSFDLMDGRKTVGGKLEVKIRIRNPLLTKQVEQVQEKWLVIDH